VDKWNNNATVFCVVFGDVDDEQRERPALNALSKASHLRLKLPKHE